MKAAAYIVLIGVLALSGLFLVSVTTKPPNDGNRSRFSGANSELRSIYARVQDETSAQFAGGSSNALGRAILSIVELMGPVGYDFFRFASGTNHVFVALNPETDFWLAPNSHTNEIAAYWPIKLRAMRGGSPGIVGICFGGTNVFLTNAPTWQALQLPVKDLTLTNGIITQ